MLILKNCRLVSFLTEGYEQPTADILVDGERIRTIAPCGTDFGCDAEVMDLEGKVLLPGLIDMHVHLFIDTMARLYNDNEKHVTDVQWTLNALDYAQVFLDAGFTTIRDVGDVLARPAAELRNRINAGKITGPRIKTSGPIIEPPFTTLNAFQEFASGPMEYRKKTRENFTKGADFIKLYGSGSLLMPSNEPGYPIIERDEIAEAVKMAKRNSSYVAIHAHGATAIDNAVREGVHTIEHASMITEETLQYIETLPYGEIGLVPTMYAFTDLLKEPDTPNGKRALALLDTIITSLKNAYFNHHILMGWGTDVASVDFRKNPMEEFRLRKEWLNYSNEDILKQATINSAQLMYLDNEIGSIKEGKYADFVIVEKDPVKDLSVLYSKPLHVIKGGTIIR